MAVFPAPPLTRAYMGRPRPRVVENRPRRIVPLICRGRSGLPDHIRSGKRKAAARATRRAAKTKGSQKRSPSFITTQL